ncbi:hypothetical protein acdb102_45000 [Acidothermaceae bacterium B102]|nr:hypothetical protein acdb102_45000 [Acidothermaceae bacterium B102]
MASNDELQEQLDALREEMRLLRSHVQPEPEGPRRAVLTRRNLLRAAPIAAIGGVVTAMSATPAAAATGQPLVLGQSNHADAVTELDSALLLEGAVTLTNDLNAITLSMPGVEISSGGAVVLDGMAGTTLRVFGGVTEIPTSGAAIVASADGNAVITAVADDAHQRFADAYNLGTAIVASSVRGTTISAESTDTATTMDAVTIDYAGTSRALYAQSHNRTNINGAITGVNEGLGIGVWGEQRNDTGSGIGVVGVGGKLGRGAQFTGGVAALRMVPTTAATHPTTGKVGDFSVDASARLWYCQKASTGSTAATWKQLA